MSRTGSGARAPATSRIPQSRRAARQAAQRVLTATLLVVLGACATQSQPQPQTIALTAEFDEAGARKLIEKGENTLTGYAFVNRGDGGFATCASGLVELIPATAYTTERMTHIYGSEEAGARSTGVFVFEPDPPEYAIVRRATTCDGKGTFEFQGVADGTFYLITGVWWEEAGQQRGANLMRRINTGEDGELDLVLTRPESSPLDRALDLLRPYRPRPSTDPE